MSEALHALEFWTGWHRDTIPLWVDGHRGEVRRLPRNLPASRELATGVRSPIVSILWAWVNSGKQLERARRFNPAPSLVLQLGRTLERFLLWPLEEPALDLSVEAANRRISYALRAPYTRSTVEALRIPLPGSMVGKKLVGCTRCEGDTFGIDEVAGGLPEPPERSWSRTAS
ncbi:MAG TPA: hypothetical protein VMT20_07230 [Terriglobia bacterium]|nr:hypothetical protein [Terriglobia bacterium]